MRSHVHLLPFVLFLAGCKSDADDDTGDPSASSHARVAIVSPADGATFTAGDPVDLEVSVTDEETGEPMEHGAVTWSATGGWTFDGDSGTVTDLPVGSYPLEVTVTLGSREVGDAVDVTVLEQHDPIAYEGPLRATLYLYSAEYDIEDEGPCDGTFTLSTDAAWAVTGGGQCHVELFWGKVDWDVVFEIDGQRDEGAVAGALFFFDDQGTRYEAPYTGTIDDAEVHVTFGEEFENEDGILRFSGTMDGTAR